MVKNFEDMCNRLDRIPPCNGRTDRRRNILPRRSPRHAYASRSKNYQNLAFLALGNRKSNGLSASGGLRLLTKDLVVFMLWHPD